MSYTVISDLFGCTVLFTLSHKPQDFQKKVLEHKMCVLMCVLTFSTSFTRNVPHYKNNSEISPISIGLHVKCPLFLSDFTKLEFFDRFFKTFQILNFIKIRPVGAPFFHANSRSRNFANTTKTNLEIILFPKFCTILHTH
jgi:hypothetical protein